jgi:GT2 family glycosyltransferase
MQPQAARIVFMPSLPFRALQSLDTVTTADEQPGLDLERATVTQTLYEQLRWADSVWCQDRADTEFIRAWMPMLAAEELPMAIPLRPERLAWSDRRGMVVGALGAHNALGGADDAAVRTLGEVLPHLRHYDPDLECTVVADGATMMLRSAASRTGARIVGRSELEREVAGARVVVCSHYYGTGQRGIIRESLAAGTPFVASPLSLGGLEVTGNEEQLTAADPVAQVRRTRRLLSDAEYWGTAVKRGDALVAARYSPERRSSRLSAILASLGITPGRPAVRPGQRLDFPRPRWNPRPKGAEGLRPDGWPVDREADGEANVHDRSGRRDEQYHLWVERKGPNPNVLLSLARQIAEMADGPLFSVLMPVYNTDPALLEMAMNSVRDQIYERWELCIGNDASDRSDTLEVLNSLRDDPRIKIVDLEKHGGISAATNAALAVAEGDYVAFLDHDDILKPHALAQMARWIQAEPSLDLVYSDEDKLDPEGRLVDPHLKPDWSPDQLLAQNYVCHLTVLRRSVAESVGGLRSKFDGSQDYDLLLRVTERTERIAHVPEPLYSWRAAQGSFAADADSKPYAIVAGREAVADALRRRGYGSEVETVSTLGRYRARFPIPGHPKVTIIIPTRDRVDLLRRCVESVRSKSTYGNFEIVIVDNQSSDPETLGYLAAEQWRVIRYPCAFNYARMVNLAAGSVETDALLFLNNDTQVISPDWMQAMLEHAMRPEVGVVGARLFFDDGRPQHEGIMIGNWGDWANNVDFGGYFHRGDMVRNASAVTGACCMIRPSVYRQVGGSDPRLRVAYNDVDLCLRLRLAGYEIVYTPYAQLYHYEGSTRTGYQHHEDGPLFGTRWDPRSVLDPYYSPVFSDMVPFQIDS